MLLGLPRQGLQNFEKSDCPWGRPHQKFGCPKPFLTCLPQFRFKMDHNKINVYLTIKENTHLRSNYLEFIRTIKNIRNRIWGIFPSSNEFSSCDDPFSCDDVSAWLSLCGLFPPMLGLSLSLLVSATVDGELKYLDKLTIHKSRNFSCPTEIPVALRCWAGDFVSHLSPLV